MSVFFKLKTKRQLINEIYRNGIPLISLEQDADGHISFKGFYYFENEDFQDICENSAYVLSYEDNELPENIIGVIKLDEFGPMQRYKAICYIDVRRDHKGSGVATNMLKFLNGILQRNNILTRTFLSSEGMQAGIDKTIKRLITNCKYCDKIEKMY